MRFLHTSCLRCIVWLSYFEAPYNFSLVLSIIITIMATPASKSRFNALLDFFIPASIAHSEDAYRRARLMLTINFLLIPLGFINNALFSFALGPTSLHAIFAWLFIANSIVTPIRLRLSKSADVSGYAFLSVVALIFFAYCTISGGIKSFFMFTLPVPVQLAILVINRRAGTVFGVVTLLFVVSVAVLQLGFGVQFRAEYSQQYDLVLTSAMALSAMLVKFLIVGVFDSGRERAERRAAREKASVQTKVEEAREALRREQEEARQRDAENLREAQQQQAYLSESTRQILEAMQRFAFGDLTVQVSDNGREDTISKIFKGFNRSVASVEKLVKQVIHNVEQTTAIASHISSASGQMAATSQEQSAQITEIASSVEETARTVSETATHASRMDALTRQTGENAVVGANVVRSAVEKMQEIATVVSNAADVVETLGNSSAEIGEIVQVIEEIADQTNLLALNAAIEAARAGEQGRGFAVVADEVRKLAERTAQATKQISQTIQQIQRDTDRAVTGMQRGEVEVQQGLTLAQQAGEALEKIVSGTREVETMVKSSAQAMEQQSSSTEEVAKSVEQMAASVEETTASLSEIARSTETLRGLTEGLQELVGQFEVGSGEAAKLDGSKAKLLSS
jgi:methyl-accepting chemotaxis protein